MIKSMTGFGRKETTIANKKITIEMKSVNHRFLEVMFKMPKDLMMLEDRMKKILQKNVKRGRIDVFITLDTDQVAQELNVNWELASQYFLMMNELKDKFQLSGAAELKDFLQIPDLIQNGTELQVTDEWMQELVGLFEQTSNVLYEMRKVEGQSISQDFLNRLDYMEELLKKVEEKAPLVVQEFREKLNTRITDWLNGTVEVDEARLLNEVAFFTDKANIDEEITRLKSHMQQFRLNLQSEEPVGRKLDFIVQEMNREVNTIGSKANHIELSQLVIELKSELEKVREQVQNVE